MSNVKPSIFMYEIFDSKATYDRYFLQGMASLVSFNGELINVPTARFICL